MNLMPDFVYSQDAIAHANKTGVRQKRTREETLRRQVSLAVVALAILFTTNVLQIGTIRAMMPLTRMIPIVLWRHDNGMTEAAVTEASLPLDLQDGTIKGWLWNYTMMREMYSGPMLDWNHHVVDAMSSVQVAEDYDKWVSAKNPNSYQKVYGPAHAGEPDRCTVFVVPDPDITSPNVTYIAPGPNGSRAGKFIFHLWRLENCRNEPPKHAVEFTAAIDFIAGYQGSLNLRDVIQFNTSRIVVIGYSPLAPAIDSVPKDIIK